MKWQHIVHNAKEVVDHKNDFELAVMVLHV